MRYHEIKGNDGVYIIHDETTRLDWESKSSSEESGRFYRKKFNWEEFSVDYINELNNEKYGGYDDWRVPTKYELRTLVNYDAMHPVFSASVFKNLMQDDYWCGNGYGMREDCAWVLNFGLGATTAAHKTTQNYGIAVRGKKLPCAKERFADNGDGTVTDKVLGLMWQKESPERKSYNDVMEMLKDFELAGYRDWRLPTISELGTIFNEDYEGKSWYYEDFFKHENLKPPILQHITSNLFKGTYVWVTNFNFGYDGYYAEKFIPLCYRLVRSVNAQNSSFHIPFSGQDKIFSAEGKVMGERKDCVCVSALDFDNYVLSDNTGIAYEKNYKDETCTFSEAKEHIKRLNEQNYGGRSDWRLPTVDELRFCVDYSKKNSAAFDIFNGSIKPEFYWTSDETVANRSWAVYFGYGCAVPVEEEQLCRCMAVSGGICDLADRSPRRYEISEKVVKDLYTGLMWLREELPLMTAVEAEEYLNGKDIAGFSDWRMPEMKELSTLFNRRSTNREYMDKEIFPHIYDHPAIFVLAHETFNAMFNWGINRNLCYDGYYADRLKGKYIIKPVRNF